MNVLAICLATRKKELSESSDELSLQRSPTIFGHEDSIKEIAMNRVGIFPEYRFRYCLQYSAMGRGKNRTQAAGFNPVWLSLTSLCKFAIIKEILVHCNRKASVI